MINGALTFDLNNLNVRSHLLEICFVETTRRSKEKTFLQDYQEKTFFMLTYAETLCGSQLIRDTCFSAKQKSEYSTVGRATARYRTVFIVKHNT